MKQVLKLLILTFNKVPVPEQTPHSQANQILSDNLAGTNEFNSLRSDVIEDLERINKMFDFMNVLCDVIMDDPKKEINKWANSKVNEHTKKINNLFLL